METRELRSSRRILGLEAHFAEKRKAIRSNREVALITVMRAGQTFSDFHAGRFAGLRVQVCELRQHSKRFYTTGQLFR